MINYIKLKINNFLQKNIGLIFISNKTYTEYIKFNFIDLRTISSEVHYSQLKNITQQKANFIINIPTSKIMYSPIQAIWIQTLRIYQNEIHSNQKTNFKIGRASCRERV